MAKDINSVLGVKQFMRMIEGIKGGVPGDILPPAFFKKTDDTIGNTGSYTKVESTRQVAQLVAYGGASINVQDGKISEVPLTLAHWYAHFDHKPTDMMNLLGMNGQGLQRMGEQVVAQKTALFTQRGMNTRRAFMYSAISQGLIRYDEKGNLLVGSSSPNTIDFSVPAGNKNQLNVDIDGNGTGDGTILTASWATAGTSIEKQIAALKVAALQKTGYPLKYALYGPGVLTNVAKNTTMKEYLRNNPGATQDIINGKIPNGFQDLIWIDCSGAFFADKDGKYVKFWADNQVVFTPDPDDMGWQGLIEGTYAVPATVDLTTDAGAALSSLRQVSGMFGYAQAKHDPTTVVQYGGDTFLPVIIVPGAIFIAQTVF